LIEAEDDMRGEGDGEGEGVHVVVVEARWWLPLSNATMTTFMKGLIEI
jgi:hypothetical protein